MKTKKNKQAGKKPFTHPELKRGEMLLVDISTDTVEVAVLMQGFFGIGVLSTDHAFSLNFLKHRCS